MFTYEQSSTEDVLGGDFPINILGKKGDTPVYFCEKCELPIKIFMQIIPCKLFAMPVLFYMEKKVIRCV